MSWFQESLFYQDAVNQVTQFNKIAGKTPANVSVDYAMGLVHEEVKETVEAYETKDKVAFLGEVCDMFVVSSFALLIKDISIDNLEKGGWNCYELEDIDKMINTPFASDVLAYSVNVLNTCDADGKGALQAVLDANMSKFSKYKKSKHKSYDEHCNTLADGVRYKNVIWERVEDYVVWKCADTSKILKGPEFKKADLTKYVYEDNK